jgi:CheY-like chemotaxis protein
MKETKLEKAKAVRDEEQSGELKEGEGKEEVISGEKVEEGQEEIEEEVPKKRIVVVDSNEKELDKTISALRKGEYTVVGVESAKEFFEITEINIKRDEGDAKAVTPEEYWEMQREGHPDLLITDLDLRDLDGWEFIYRLKYEGRYFEYKEIPIIVRTDVPITIETTKKFQAESIHDYIPKSVKGKELLQKIDKYFDVRERLLERKKEAVPLLGYRVADEYVRISFAIRIRLKYLFALKERLEEIKREGEDQEEIKKLEEIYYLQRRELIKYERRKLEIKKILKVKKDERAKRRERESEAQAN